jgi:GGDEF domain-containing protein
MTLETPTDSAPIGAVEQTDPLMRFGSRSNLLSDLHETAAPGAPTQVLALFDIAGFTTFAEDYGRIEGEGLLVRIADHLTSALGDDATYYRPRYDEFAVLIPTSDGDPNHLLAEAIAAVNTHLTQSNVTLAFGTVTVPLEAPDPLSALTLADTRLFLRAPARRSRERRSAPR